MSKTKKENKLLKLVTGAALALALGLSMAAPAFAGETTEPTTLPLTGSAQNPAQASLTKVMQMPTGTEMPPTDFQFEFKEKSLNGRTDTASLAAMPPLGPETLSFTSTGATDADTTTPGVIDLVKETGDFLDGIVWPQTGEYVYTVSEDAKPDYSIIKPFESQWNFSTAKYDLYVYVKEDGGIRYVPSFTVIDVLVIHRHWNCNDNSRFNCHNHCSAKLIFFKNSLNFSCRINVS